MKLANRAGPGEWGISGDSQSSTGTAKCDGLDSLTFLLSLPEVTMALRVTESSLTYSLSACK